MFSSIASLSFSSATQQAAQLKQFKYHLCSHHPAEGGSAQVQVGKGDNATDEFIVYGKPVANDSPVVKALGDKFMPGQVAVSVPKHIFESLPTHEH